jgi:hypothetical protein
MLEEKTPPLGLGHLDNRSDPQSGKTIHPQKVARLQWSLYRPIFPTLNPDEIEQVARTFDLSLDQKVRLHAAVLATAVQAMLAGRISVEDARLAGWQVLPTIELQLREHWDDNEGFGAARDPFLLTEAPMGNDVDDFTAEYGAALIEIDRGKLELTLAERTLVQRERRASARAALGAFEAALAILAPVPEETDDMMLEAGKFWQEEAHQGIQAAKRLLV